MMNKLISIVLFSIFGLWAYQNRYRLMNGVLGNTMLRRFAVSSLLGMPGVRRKMFQAVFPGTSEL